MRLEYGYFPIDEATFDLLVCFEKIITIQYIVIRVLSKWWTNYFRFCEHSVH